MKKYVDNFMQYRFLLSELVKKGIKLKYRRSYLGMIWSMLEPLLTMIVLTIVFGTLYGNTDRTFPVYILTGRLLYSFFSQSTKAALKSIRQNSAMIKKVYVPKYLYPLSSVLFNYVIFLISLIVPTRRLSTTHRIFCIFRVFGCLLTDGFVSRIFWWHVPMLSW